MDNIWIYSLGLLAQGLFSARMLVQWVLSEKARKVVNPSVFWVLSLAASLIFFIYGWLREDFALMLGQVIGYYAYIWNMGAKGLWNRIGKWKTPVIILLMAVPVAALCHMAADWNNVADTLFRNGDIPRSLLLFGTAGRFLDHQHRRLRCDTCIRHHPPRSRGHSGSGIRARDIHPEPDVML